MKRSFSKAPGGRHRRLLHSELWNRDFPKLQVLSIKELLEEGKRPNLPPFVASPYQKAERVREQAEKPRML